MLLSTDRERDLCSLLGNLARNIFGDSHGLGGPDFLGDNNNFLGDSDPSFGVSTFLDVESGESELLPVLTFLATFSVLLLLPTTFLGEVSCRMGILEP